MSDLIFNLRIAKLHIQITRAWRLSFSVNPHYDWRKWPLIELYEPEMWLRRKAWDEEDIEMGRTVNAWLGAYWPITVEGLRERAKEARAKCSYDVAALLDGIANLVEIWEDDIPTECDEEDE